MSSPWNHALCSGCWSVMRMDREPARLNPPTFEDCCVCGGSTQSGLYFSRDPSGLPCRGDHSESPGLLRVIGGAGKERAALQKRVEVAAAQPFEDRLIGYAEPEEAPLLSEAEAESESEAEEVYG